MVPRLNITTSYTDINKENRTPNVPSSSSQSYTTSYHQYRPHSNIPPTGGLPTSLGQARNLPQLTLNIPELPVFKTTSAPNLQTPTETYKVQETTKYTSEMNESLNHSMHSVDYVPSETGSLLDQDILESIYTMNRGHNDQPVKIIDEPVREEPTHWLRKGDRLKLMVLRFLT